MPVRLTWSHALTMIRAHVSASPVDLRAFLPIPPLTRILITDGEQRSSLAAVRSLGRAGHEVHVCATRRRSLAGASRFAAATHQVPDPATDPGAYRSGVLDIVRSQGVGILLPMTDVAMSLLLDLRGEAPDLVIPFPDMDTYRAVSDKRNLMEVARRAGVPVPQQVVVDAPPSGALTLEGLDADEPVVLKPARSAVEGASGVQKFGVRMLERAGDAAEALQEFPAEAFPVLVQRRIVGPGLGAFLLADRGRVLATFGHRRIREKPPTGGVSVYREAVRLRDDVRRHAEALVEAFGWTGVAMVEFKEDAATGTPYLMEINGRFWGSLQLAIDAGVDFPRLLVDMAEGRPVPPGIEPKEGARSRWLWGDVDHLLWMLRRGRHAWRSDPTLPTPLGALGRFLVPWRPGDRFEVLRLSDPGPFLRETAQWFGDALR